MKRYMPVVLVAVLALFATQAGANLIQNGQFSSGFSSWTIGTTGNGTWGSGYPVTAPFPPNNGVMSAEGEVGEVSFTGVQEGGTLTQMFTAAAGATTVSLDWAVMSPGGNADGGEFTILLNGTQIAQFDTGNINGNQLYSGTLTGTGTLLNGTNTLELDVTRRYITVPNGTPYQWLTDVNVTGTPEPGSLILMGSGVLGLAGVLRRKIGF